MIYIKTDKEIELMRAPCRVVRDALLVAEENLKAVSYTHLRAHETD